MGKTGLHALARRSAPGLAPDREREKRKRILKMCVQKLRDIDDPETVLCRAVLINNTFKTLKYAQRRLLAPEPEPVRQQQQEGEGERAGSDSDDTNEEEEEEEGGEDQKQESVDNDENFNSDEAGAPSLDSRAEAEVCSTAARLAEPAALQTEEIDCLSNVCDMNSYSAESIVHSLVMPPLLSPQLEDMTNCSFYDTFGDGSVLGGAGGGPDSQAMHTSLKLTVLGGEGEQTQQFGKEEFQFCHNKADYCLQTGDIGNSLLIDNLLTEIVQA